MLEDDYKKPLDGMEFSRLIYMIWESLGKTLIILSFYRDVARSRKMAKKDAKKLKEITRGIYEKAMNAIDDIGRIDKTIITPCRKSCGSNAYIDIIAALKEDEKNEIVRMLHDSSSVSFDGVMSYMTFCSAFDEPDGTKQRLLWLNRQFGKETARVCELCENAMRKIAPEEFASL